MAARKKVTGARGGEAAGARGGDAAGGRRLADIARALEEMIGGDLERQLPISAAQDDLDAICYGVNILVGELAFATANLRRVRAAAEAANAAKSAFLRAASHELRTPLAVIVWLAELIKDPAQVPVDQLASFLAGIHGSAKELLRTTEAILDLSRLEQAPEPALEATDLAGVAREAVETLRPLAEGKAITLVIVLEPGAPTRLLTHAQHVRQVLVNLLANAIKFSPRGEIVVRIHRDGSRVAVDVEDPGVGIPAAARERLFEPFYQVDRAVSRRLGGTGLGLALSKHLAERLGGDLCLHASKEGEGSTFRFTIPLRTPIIDGDGAPPDSGKSTPTRARRLDGVRVLVAEDEDQVRAVLCRMLETAGARVGLARNGEEAIAKALAETFDVVLMDIKMPVLDGLRATSRLRAAGFGRPIVALTANPTAEQRAASLAAGCDDHLTKPIAAAQLVGRLADLSRPAARAGGEA